jgi:hypothetical protein
VSTAIQPWGECDLPEDVLRQREVEEAMGRGAFVPRWGWAIPRPYNGYTGAERIKGWQIVRVAQRMGLLERPRACSVCGRTSNLHHHSELYGRPLLAQPICKSCHFHVHRRFRLPDGWQAFVGKQRECQWIVRLAPVELARTEALALEGQISPFGLGNGSIRSVTDTRE